MQHPASIRRSLPFLLAVALTVALLAQAFPADAVQAHSLASSRALAPIVPSDDWKTYLGNKLRTGFNAAESILTPGNVAHLQLKWSQFAAGGVTVQPVEFDHVVYWGSWDGFEHAFTTAGARLWDTQIGRTSASGCKPKTVGVTSAAAVGDIGSTRTIFVAGGNATFYALNAVTGAVIWSTRLGSSPNHFLWASTLIVDDSVYIGVASFCDRPLVQGQFVQLNASTGAIEHIFNTVPAGCTGGAVWGSPTLGKSGAVIYIATGNAGPCSSNEPYAPAIVELRASDLSVIDSWRLPLNAQSGDKDFGSTPTVFDVATGSTTHHFVGVANKNGTYYTFDRMQIGAGPVWQVRIADDHADCPMCGDGSISPSAWDGTTLYVAGGNTTINGTRCKGSLRALNTLTGASLWQDCLHSGPVLGAVTVINGVVMVAQGTEIDMFNAATGKTVFTYTDSRRGSTFFSGAAVAEGKVFQGNLDGYLYAFGL